MDDLLGLPLAEPHSVGLTEDEGDRVPDTQAVALMVPLVEPEADKQRDDVGLPLGLLEIEGVPVAHAVAVIDTVPHPLPESAGELVLHPEPLPLRLPVTVPVAERLGLPLADAHAVAHPLAVGDRVGEEQAVAVTDTLGDTVEDRQRDAVGEMVGHAEEEMVPLPHALGDAVAVPQALRLGLPEGDPQGEGVAEARGERDEDAHRVGVPEVQGEPEEERHREVVGLFVGLREKEGVAEEQPLPVPERVGDSVWLPLPLLLRQRLGLGEMEGEVEEVPQREAVALTVGLRDGDVVVE